MILVSFENFFWKEKTIDIREEISNNITNDMRYMYILQAMDPIHIYLMEHSSRHDDQVLIGATKI